MGESGGTKRPPFKQANSRRAWCGYLSHGEVLDWVKLNLVDKSGAYMPTRAIRSVRARQTCEVLDDNPALATEIEDEIRRQTMNLPLTEREAPEASESAPVEKSAEG